MQGVFKVQILSFKIFIKPSLWMITTNVFGTNVLNSQEMVSVQKYSG